MRKTWMPITAVLLGFAVWNLFVFVVDVSVQQIYPVPAELWRHATLVEIIATRPDAAVALNLAGGVIATAAAAYFASRFAGERTARAGIVATCLILLMALTNSIVTHNFRWLHAIALTVAPILGYWGAKRGAVWSRK